MTQKVSWCHGSALCWQHEEKESTVRVQGSGWAAGHGQRGAGVGTSRSVMSMARTAPAAQEGSIRQQQDGGTALRLPLLLPSADKANYRAARRVELTSGCTAAVHQGPASPPSTAPRRSACDGLTWCGVAAPCPSLSPRAHRARPLLAALLRCGTLGLCSTRAPRCGAACRALRWSRGFSAGSYPRATRTLGPRPPDAPR